MSTQTAAAHAAAVRQATVAAELTSTPWLPAPTDVPPSPSATTAPTLAAAAPTDTAAPSATPDAAARYRLAFYSNLNNEDGLYLMDPDHPDDWSQVMPPADYELLAWPSFCGATLAYEAGDRSQNLPTWIFTQALSGGEPARLETPGEPPQRITQPGCSQDGRFVAFTALRAGRRYLSLLDREQNTLLAERVAGEYTTLGFATWLPAEDLVLWMGVKASGYFDINQTSHIAEGPVGPTRVVAQGKYPAISPDGTRLVYFCGNLLNLCMVERETGELLFQIPVSYFKKINKKAVPATAAWSADGKWVYFSSSILGNWDIYRMRPDGSQVRNLTETWTSDEYMPTAR
jgi:hypothetical protein